jgi:copper chaperone NosL
MRLPAAVILASCVAACSSGPPRPVAIDTLNDQCGACRMVISDPRFAAQVVAPGEEPRLYDDLLCLRDGLAASPPAPGARIFVADHRTGAWVAVDRAVFVRAPGVATPMASQWIAYADDASRQADPPAGGAARVAASEILGPAAEPEGTPPGGTTR